MATNKTPIYAFPVPAYDYGAGGETTAVAEFTSSMSAAASAVLVAINTISNNISVISAAIANFGDPDVVSAQLASVSAVLIGQKDALSNAVSVLSNQVSTINTRGIIKAINTAAQASISVSVPVTVSGVSLPLTAGSSYYFQFTIPYTAKNLAGGLTIAVTGPAMTSFISRVGIPTGGTALATAYTFGTIGAIGGIVSCASNPLSGTTLIAVVEGFANPSASAGLHVAIGVTTEATASTLRVLLGAQGRAWKLS